MTLAIVCNMHSNSPQMDSQVVDVHAVPNIIVGIYHSCSEVANFHVGHQLQGAGKVIHITHALGATDLESAVLEDLYIETVALLADGDAYGILVVETFGAMGGGGEVVSKHTLVLACAHYVAANNLGRDSHSADVYASGGAHCSLI